MTNAVSAPSQPEGFDYFEVAADVGVHAWGPDLAACFRQCARGVFNLIVPLEAVAPAESREAAAQGESPEVLLVNWINELVYLHDIEGFVLHDLDTPRFEGSRIHANLTGEPVAPDRHPRGIVVKAATFHGLAFEQTPGRVSARLVLDI